MGAGTSGQAQEAVRASLAGETAARAKREAASRVGYYNVKWGDLRLRTTAGSAVEFNDNVNLATQNQVADWVFRPQLQAQFVYPVTVKNSLNLNIGAGYSYYLKEDRLSRYFITPDSELSFDVFAGDCLINLYDRFSVSQDAYQNPATTGTGNVGTFNNSAGLSTTWDLNDLLVAVGYDFQIQRSTTAGFNQQDATTHSLFGQAGVRPNDFSVVGLEAGGSLIDRDRFSGGNQVNVGLFYRTQISAYLSLQAGAGYTVFAFDQAALAGGKSQVSGAYGNLAVQHRVNRILSHSLSAGLDQQIGLFSSGLELYYLRWSGSWNLIQKLSLGTHVAYEWGKEYGGANDQLERWGLGFTLGRGITEKLGAQFAYDWLNRDSDQINRSYTQNRYTLSLNYRF